MRRERLTLMARSESGMALIFAVGLIAILMTFLIAAQGSVQVSRLQMRRSADRAQQAETTASLLATAQQRIARGEEVLESDALRYESQRGPGLRDVQKLAFRMIGDDAEFYAGLPGIEPRPGDVLVTLNWLTEIKRTDDAEWELREEEIQNYLINTAHGRSGAIRLR